MKPFVLVLCAVAAFASLADAQDSPVPAASKLPTAVLSKPYAVTLGDMLSLCITQTMPVLKDPWGFNADATAIYDREDDKIRVTIFGTRTSVDEAKASMEQFRTKVIPLLAAQVAKSYRLTLDESALSLIYVTRATMHEVIRREGAKYVVAE